MATVEEAIVKLLRGEPVRDITGAQISPQDFKEMLDTGATPIIDGDGNIVFESYNEPTNKQIAQRQSAIDTYLSENYARQQRAMKQVADSVLSGADAAKAASGALTSLVRRRMQEDNALQDTLDADLAERRAREAELTNAGGKLRNTIGNKLKQLFTPIRDVEQGQPSPRDIGASSVFDRASGDLRGGANLHPQTVSTTSPQTTTTPNNLVAQAANIALQLSPVASNTKGSGGKASGSTEGKRAGTTATGTTAPKVEVSAPIPQQTNPTTYVDPRSIADDYGQISPQGYEIARQGTEPLVVDPVSFYGDNAGIDHFALEGITGQGSNSWLRKLARGALANGKLTLGSVDDYNHAMQQIDFMNAYEQQAHIANRMQDLMSQGRSAQEARYEALTERMLQNGMGRGAVSVTLPEYANQADARAKTTLDAVNASGGDYYARGSFGYTPLGLSSLVRNDDGTGSMNIYGTKVTGISPEAMDAGVYAVLKGGDGSGTKSIANAQNAIMRSTISSGGSRGLTLDQRIALEEAKQSLQGDKQIRVDAEKQANKGKGNTTSVQYKTPL